MDAGKEFFNIYNHDFIRLAAAVPEVKVADPAFNAEKTIALMRKAAEQKAILVVFPELGLSAYSCDDLFHQQALLSACMQALSEVLVATRDLPVIAIVGLPLKIDDMLFNCATVIYRGHIHGIVPKTYLPNYREFYELRQFTPGDRALRDSIALIDQTDIPFGNRLLFRIDDQPLFTFYIEICEDLWVPIPPSSYAALAGATVILNPSASNVTVTKDDYRRQLVANQSARCLAAYIYTAAGFGESTTDLAWDGQAIIYENGTRIAESMRFSYSSQIVTGDIDLNRLSQERMRQTSFSQTAQRHHNDLALFRTIHLQADLPCQERLLIERTYERFPFVPSDRAGQDDRCKEVYEIQVQGLAKRLKSTDTKRVVIGVSGGLDSTQALIVCAHAMDVLELPRTNIGALIMPGFATSSRTLDQAQRLTTVIGCATREIDIKPSCMQMFRDIGHPFAEGQPVYDIAFENVQAGERTSHLFRFANLYQGLVVGTSDLSELALGWSTYGVGDHMAHYHVNASVPKTLIQYLIHWAAQKGFLGDEVNRVLFDVLGTTISPELIPGNNEDKPEQHSEHVIGPYELQDFHLYYILRFGFLPAKVAFLAWSAWHDKNSGTWPNIPQERQHEYTIGEIKKWLKVFIERFFKSSQYKRSCIANSPKVGSGGSLSPRGDYRAPSDSEATPWLADLDNIPETDQG
ncbi:MAG: NAD(+) synthase [Proteobacteria bacterium]|nr:NAD(+) synthase [Pseudomonadota bacterium]